MEAIKLSHFRLDPLIDILTERRIYPCNSMVAQFGVISGNWDTLCPT